MVNCREHVVHVLADRLLNFGLIYLDPRGRIIDAEHGFVGPWDGWEQRMLPPAIPVEISDVSLTATCVRLTRSDTARQLPQCEWAKLCP